MPRTNRPRDVRGEDYLAERIRRERSARGWTPERLAKEMTASGCPIQTSAIYKIEGGNPRRRITVEELLGFSSVFGLPPESLLTDPSLLAGQADLDATRADGARPYTFPARLRQLRHYRGMTRKQLADRCAEIGYPRLTESAIVNLERGAGAGRTYREVTVPEWLAIAIALRVPASSLLVPPGEPGELVR